MTTPTGNTPVQTYTYDRVNDPTYILSLLHIFKDGTGQKWDTPNLTYSFGAKSSIYVGDYYEAEYFKTYYLNTAQKQVVREVLDEISQVIPIQLTEVKDSASVTGDLRFGGYRQMPREAYAWAYHPNQVLGPEGGDVWFSDAIGKVRQWDKGSYEYLAVIHEIGHALALKHSFEGQYKLGRAVENHQFTVMSYTAAPNNLYWNGKGAPTEVYPETLMLYDIAALQYLYGANTEFNNGGDTYSYDPRHPFYATIWDGGGLGDEIDISNFSTDCVLNLGAGEFSSLAISSAPATDGFIKKYGTTPTYNGVNNLAIAYNVTIENATGGKGEDIINGNDADNHLSGNQGNDILRGKLGNDSLTGGSGADVFLYYSADTGWDTVTDFFDYDTLRFIDHYDEDAQRYVYIDFDDFTIAAGDGANVARHEIQYEVTPGGVTLYFGLDDTPGAADIAITLAGQYDIGSLTMSQSDITISVPAVDGTEQNDTLAGDDGRNSINGQGGADRLTGGKGEDLLNGGSGADIMRGGRGDDIYIVDDKKDKVIENHGQGEDTVRASINYSLGSHLENLTLTGNGNLKGTGNKGNNFMIGNSGDNTLDGGAGVDKFAGGAGNDTFILDHIQEVMIENENEGVDTIIAKFNSNQSYTLQTNFENLTMKGTGKISITGNDLDNYIIGNANPNTITGLKGNDTLNGGKGADTMSGGDGNDTYYVDTLNDIVIEAKNAGNDTIVSALKTYTLSGSGQVENLTLTGGAIKGYGNDFNNTLTGNNKNNVLDGGNGNDVISGGAGRDTLVGGMGNDVISGGAGSDVMTGGFGFDQETGNFYKDVFVFNTAIGKDVDRITDFVSRNDDIHLDQNIFSVLPMGQLAQDSFVSGVKPKALDGNDYILFDTGTGAVYYDADANGSGKAIQFLVLDKIAPQAARELFHDDVWVV